MWVVDGLGLVPSSASWLAEAEALANEEAGVATTSGDEADGATPTLSATADAPAADWPAPGSGDTELGVLMELEVCHGETEVYSRVQA